MVSIQTPTLTSELAPPAPATSLRLRPIERPRGLLLRLFNWLVRKQMGKVMMPAKVIYARFPSLLWRNMLLYHLLDRGLSIESELRHLIEVHVAAVNGCSFCHDIHLASAMRDRANRACRYRRCAQHA
jgi:AhpD family alkylhydroperoxidase